MVALLVPCAAQAAESYYIEDMTWPEVKARMAKGVDTVIIPSGGTEQNGPHIVIGKHNMIVHYTSGEIAKALGNALVAPVITYVPEGSFDPAEGHMLFPGTISVEDDVFGAILEDAARSFKHHGFKYICFIGDHGGNQHAQKLVADKLTYDWQKDGVRVINVSDYYADKEAADWVKSQKLTEGDPQAHAGFMDASEVMAIDKNGVRPAFIKHYSEKDFDKLGVKGDPAQASAAHGKKLLAFKIKAAVDQIKRESAKK